ncbi:hypothetical protein AKJ61_02900 [candidate division MSBL1 archaeon SCGC-AAA259B11]|uniref:Transcription elongation factor Spt5 n=1 Tax=candidate division MSBL1 archaeon SCGC-AAA259B11 TaxID=1698260 RepID=A0A133U5F9_9EURY|nr:hypothetical protein AKJ61_02900 [candidate division MSBL1 archaeon SCGC-AAA259B11]
MEEEKTTGNIFTVRIIGGREEMAAKLIRSHARMSDHPVYSIIVPEKEMKGYIFVEAGNLGAVKRVVEGVKPVKSVMSDPSTPDELKDLLGPKIVPSSIGKGDKIRIVGGGLRGREGKVIETKPEEREIVMEVDDPAVPAPLTISTEEVERK